MFIDPLNPFSGMTAAGLTGNPAAEPSAKSGAGEFSRLLETASDQRSRVAMVEFTRLQMMQSMTTWEEDEAGDEPFGWNLISDPASMALSRQNSAPVGGTRQNILNEVQPNRLSRLGHQAYRQQQPENPTERAVARAADRFDLDPQLLHAVIKAESNYDRQAVSPAGAQGLMQLMPGTAREMGVSDPFNAEENIMGGARYLRKMLDRYQGHLDSALAAYNWGPGNFERNPDRLPRETSQYIAKIRTFLEQPSRS